jgi:hypothetical protein
MNILEVELLIEGIPNNFAWKNPRPKQRSLGAGLEQHEMQEK